MKSKNVLAIVLAALVTASVRLQPWRTPENEILHGHSGDRVTPNKVKTPSGRWSMSTASPPSRPLSWCGTTWTSPVPWT